MTHLPALLRYLKLLTPFFDIKQNTERLGNLGSSEVHNLAEGDGSPCGFPRRLAPRSVSRQRHDVVQDCGFPPGPGSMALAGPCFLFLPCSYKPFLQEDRRCPAVI